MKKILIGAVRSKGSFTEGKKTVKYDNIKLYLADYRDFKTHGFSVDKNTEPVKIRTQDFAEVSGISVKEFLTRFEKDYMFHKVRVIGEENDYGRTDVIEIKFSDENCFDAWKRLRDLEIEAKLSRMADDEFDIDEDEDLEDEGDDDSEEEYEEETAFSVDTVTGEVKPKKA